ncbi:hypothetical protein HOU00_gp177 [Caulobacter phage CcrPW]|uniref:Uncharacterized protein n=1 Tax=Caulobacter phage CcrPW TaxID=2283271 RepID=A0A385EDX8_9CAUD|nr:hypothetical protein HOU00_gp177 [Caulobacter phage CcrPW]AXQ68948.1 hypothetical protein CcrPW_gp409c [Caulobacter phage CcrPW]
MTKPTPEIAAAIKLLRKAGYEIEPPAPVAPEEVKVKLKAVRDPNLTPAQVAACFRMTGFQPSAEQYPHSPEGFAWLCRFNGARPEQVPWTWHYASSAGMRDYVERLARENPA